MRFLEYLKRFTYTPNIFYNYEMVKEDAMAGDMLLVVDPDEPDHGESVVVGAITEDDEFVYEVEVRLESEAGRVHEWFNGEMTASITSTTAGTGTAAIVDTGAGTTKVALVNGVGKIQIKYTLNWAADDTCTVKVSPSNVNEVMGYALAEAEMVDTIADDSE